MKALASNQTITWFYQRYKEDSLELSADFQRNPVWMQPQKDYLIETLLLGLPVPEIYMVNRITADGESKYVVVDGQQRLRTIIEFINGDFELKKRKPEFTHIKTFADLSDSEKREFWRYPVVVRDLEDSSDIEIRDLFQRLNKYSVVLNEQELRNARFKGAFLNTIERLAENEFWTTSGVFSSNDIRRMLDLEFASILLCTLIGGIFNRKERLDEFYVMYEDEFEEANFYIERFHHALEIIEMVVPSLKRARWKNKADFFALFLAIDELRVSKDDSDSLEKIKNKLAEFSVQIENAKNDPDNAEQVFREYLDAATYGTNDKEKRLRRRKILLNILKEDLEGV